MAQRATARVDHDAIAANCARLRRELAAGVELCAVVKADGYGHGVMAAARAAQEGGAGRLAVATAHEAAELAAELPGVPLLTLGALREEGMDIAIGAGSEFAVWTEEGVRMAAERAGAAGRPARIHVKFDSGMGRLGSRDPVEVVQLARACAEHPQLELAGLWTHFATADDRGSDYFDRQLRQFEELAAEVRAEHPTVRLHAANSAAVLRDPRSHFDMVRCGIAIYGLDPFGLDAGAWGLTPALSLRSFVGDVKWFPAGASAGYTRSWQAERGTWVAVLPIGYGDGVRRSVANRGEVLIGGERLPIVGNVSMDNITVDLGPETRVRPGDDAVLIGTQGAVAISGEQVAAWQGTINYEVTTSLTARVVREAVGVGGSEDRAGGDVAGDDRAGSEGGIDSEGGGGGGR